MYLSEWQCDVSPLQASLGDLQPSSGDPPGAEADCPKLEQWPWPEVSQHLALPAQELQRSSQNRQPSARLSLGSLSLSNTARPPPRLEQAADAALIPLQELHTQCQQSSPGLAALSIPWDRNCRKAGVGKNLWRSAPWQHTTELKVQQNREQEEPRCLSWLSVSYPRMPAAVAAELQVPREEHEHGFGEQAAGRPGASGGCSRQGAGEGESSRW